MGDRGTEGHKDWLFDLAHGDLDEGQIVTGFIKFYALEGFTVGNVQDDLLHRTLYGQLHMGRAMHFLRSALEDAAGGTRIMGAGGAGTEGEHV